ncbi:MAG TPA: gliding motility-associated C-terminal domain-containing protein [Saprospiraceae bacterium]|nr:gliding motility-associated C-terminal domain-containing protein [Saprospiraceae bacterium]
MKSNYLVKRLFLLTYLVLHWCVNGHAQFVRFYSECPPQAEAGTDVCIPILVENFKDYESSYLELNINELAFTLKEVRVPAKNPLELACTNILNDECSLSYQSGVLRFLDFGHPGAEFNDGDTLFIICGTLGEAGNIFSINPDRFNTAFILQDTMTGNSTQVNPDSIGLDFCPFMVKPVGNQLTIISGVCDKSIGPVEDGKLFLKFLGGTGPYSYTISGAKGFSESGNGIVQDLVLNNLPEDIYMVTITDASGMSTGPTSVVVSTNQKFTLTIDKVKNPDCFLSEIGTRHKNGKIVVTTTGGAGNPTYIWSTNQVTTSNSSAVFISDSIEQLLSGSYSVKVIDRSGCEIDTSFSLQSPTQIVADLKSAIIGCVDGQRGEVEIEISGGTPKQTGTLYKYQIDNGAIRDFGDSDIGPPFIGRLDNVKYGSEIIIRDLLNCEVRIPLLNPDSTSKFTFDSIFLQKDTISFNCFEDPGLITVGNRLQTTLNFLAPVMTNIQRVGDPSYVYSGQLGTNRIPDILMPEGVYLIEVEDVSAKCKDALTFNIIRPPQFLADSVIARPDCQDTLGSILINATGGTMPYLYTWSQDLTKTDSLLDSIVSGNYNISVTDANNCNVSNFNINIEPSNVLKIDSIKVIDTILCGESGILEVYTNNPNANILWSNGDTTARLVTETAGKYLVTISEQGRCAQVDSIILPEIVNYRVFTTKFDPSCGANIGSTTGTIDIDTILGGTSGFSYTWAVSGTNTVLSTSSSVSGLSPGLYDLRITDGSNCGYDTTFELTAPAPLNIALDPASVRGVSCNQGSPDGRAAVTVSGGLGSTYRYQWSNSERGPMAQNLPFGANTVFALDSTGCVSDTITVNIPEAQLPTIVSSFTIPSCLEAKDGTITLDIQKRDSADVVNVIWNIDSVAQTGPTATNVGIGTYQYLVNVNGNLNCPIFDTVRITDAKVFSLEIDPLTTSDNTCKAVGTSGTIGLLVQDGSGPVKYTFNGDSIVGPVGTDLAPGTYNIIGRNAVGCADTLEHTLDFNMQVTADVVAFEDPKCIGEKICINPTNVTGGNGRGYRFGIDFGAPQDITECVELLPGDYFMQVYDSDGCRFDTSFTIGVPETFEIDLGEDITFNIGDDMPEIMVEVVNGGNIESVVWADAVNVDCMDNSCVNVRIAQIGAFTLRADAVSVDGCLASDEITIRVNEKENVFVPNIFRPGTDNADDKNNAWHVTIGRGVEKVLGIRIFDRWGNKLFEAADEAGLDEETSWDGTFKGTQLNPGVFVYEVDVEFVKRADEAAARKKVFTGTITLVR